MWRETRRQVRRAMRNEQRREQNHQRRLAERIAERDRAIEEFSDLLRHRQTVSNTVWQLRQLVAIRTRSSEEVEHFL